MQRCDVWPISMRSPNFFQALKSAEHLGGNGGGNSLLFLSLLTLKFDSRRLHQRFLLSHYNYCANVGVLGRPKLTELRRAQVTSMRRGRRF